MLSSSIVRYLKKPVFCPCTDAVYSYSWALSVLCFGTSCRTWSRCRDVDQFLGLRVSVNVLLRLKD
jgi:hypothetical protein